ncbi:hypothetical protein [Thermomonas sp.]|uniref:hypothetical protein n=1 Tax=Thermomonas sp. TaxID=1971895 RepID=UPI0035AF3883
MRLPTLQQLLVGFALLGSCTHVAAAELRHLPAEPAVNADAATGQIDRMEEADIDGAVAASHAQRPQRARTQAPAPAARTAGDTRALPSRFHSFLPGMFR